MSAEKWKPLPYEPFNEVYSISNKGRIKSKTRTVKVISEERGEYERTYKGRIITMRKNKKSPHLFTTISMVVDGEKNVRTIYPHKAAALAFIPNPDNKKHVSHKELDYENNNVDNLFWSNQSDISIRNMELNPELKNTLKNNNIRSGWLKNRKKRNEHTE